MWPQFNSVFTQPLPCRVQLTALVNLLDSHFKFNWRLGSDKFFVLKIAEILVISFKNDISENTILELLKCAAFNLFSLRSDNGRSQLVACQKSPANRGQRHHHQHHHHQVWKRVAISAAKVNWCHHPLTGVNPTHPLTSTFPFFTHRKYQPAIKTQYSTLHQLSQGPTLSGWLL